MPDEAAAAGRDGLAALVAVAQSAAGFAPARGALRAGRSIAVDCAWGSAAPLALAALSAEAEAESAAIGVGLIVLAHPCDVDAWAADIESFSGIRPELFPPFESWPSSRDGSDASAGHRLQLLQRLRSSRPPRWILATMAALVQPVPSLAALAARQRIIRANDTVDLEELSTWLVERGYRRVDAVEVPGDFSRRGGILDVYSPDHEHPVRLELFGDEVESLRRFAADTQRSMGDVAEVGVMAIADIVVDRESETRGRAKGMSSRHPTPDSRNPNSDTGHFIDHLPSDSWTALIEPIELREQAERYRERVDPVGLFSTDGCFQQLVSRPSVTVTALPQASVEATWSLRVESVERFSGKIDQVRDELDSVAEAERAVIACPTEAEMHRLGELLAASRLAGSRRLEVVRGYVRSGFRLVEAGVIVIGSHELFHREDPASAGVLSAAPKRRIESRAIDSFLELNEGDYVVHIAHGLALFRGMALLERGKTLELTPQEHSGSADEEHLILEFRDGVRVYVPASKIDLVQKYVGGTKSQPELSKLGGLSWGRRKDRVQEAVRDLAVEMLQMQAVRGAQQGFSFPPDSDWQREFEAAFPYQETADQLASLKEIKADLERARPMDRLVCGDVGFGKTELALRAAFKTVDNGAQVAVLVPTTVLAEQHYRTFTERFSEYPFTVACLNRFRPASEQRRIVRSIAEGGVDVIIGTHRVTSADVKFKNLGLVIIDEEQRFGVDHKERLKRLRLMVDVLTMTATPIPRTLHLSLLGIRDISNLETAPAERLPIETRITRFDRPLIRQAILRELNRDGQVYFVHNRVQDIYEVAARVHDIVPEARIAVAHGQQAGDELEEAMLSFVQKRVDVLVATTIVESGLDIPNANTIFINEADRYGLADLHQLRGRVGRHKVRAYAYLLLEPDRMVSPEAARRLKAIEEFTALGAGFRIALRDLEIRGAGNILGAQQSGHIAAVGYEMYCHLLENAVRSLKNMAPRQATLDVAVDVPWPAFLPRDYVPGQKQRLEVYRRLSRVRDPHKLTDFRQELRDRYGPLPNPAEWLLRLVEVRLLASKWKLESLHRDGPDMVLTYKSAKLMDKLAVRAGKRFRVVDAKQAYYRLTPADEQMEHLYPTLVALLAKSADLTEP